MKKNVFSLENMFVQGQVASDTTLLAFLNRLQKQINLLVPNISAAELKKKISECNSTEEKARVFHDKCLRFLHSTALSIYGLATLAMCLKSTYAVASSMMVKKEKKKRKWNFKDDV